MFLFGWPYFCAADNKAISNEDVSTIGGSESYDSIGIYLLRSPSLHWLNPSSFAQHVFVKVVYFLYLVQMLAFTGLEGDWDPWNYQIEGPFPDMCFGRESVCKHFLITWLPNPFGHFLTVQC